MEPPRLSVRWWWLVGALVAALATALVVVSVLVVRSDSDSTGPSREEQVEITCRELVTGRLAYPERATFTEVATQVVGDTHVTTGVVDAHDDQGTPARLDFRCASPLTSGRTVLVLLRQRSP